MELRGRHHVDEEHWIPLADLMTGLMLLFLLISITYMVQVKQQADRAHSIAVLYERTRLDLYQDLDREFHNDFPRWGAELDPDSTIRFTEPEVLFETGSADLRPRFTAILSNFFPRYVRILRSSKYREAVTEVRIEGHTSSQWAVGMPRKEAYINNMALSQERTRSVLEYVLEMPALGSSEDWLMSKVTANGLSSSHLIKVNGKEDAVRSQRVEFRVRTDADDKIRSIKALGNDSAS
jgi:outer membrane protein OmpA-like peptidoglycan-associated protein